MNLFQFEQQLDIGVALKNIRMSVVVMTTVVINNAIF